MSPAEERSAMFNHVFAIYFGGNVARLSIATGYSKQQIEAWMRGVSPNRKTLERICSVVFVPEFRVVCEYAEVGGGAGIHTQLNKILSHHKNDSGVYAFYDARAQLLYVGKATRLLAEMNNALNRSAQILFPKGVKKRDFKVCDLVRYVSAYNVKRMDGMDHAKHIESLILRISKPPINKNIGRLEPAHPPMGPV